MASIYNIVDQPNARSSHSRVTVRGGGIIFPITVIISFLMGDVRISLFLSLLMVSLVSFIDDIRPVSQKIRFIIHLFAVSLVFYNLNFNIYNWYIPIIVVIVMTGWVNAFNFMDGINGILVLYALVSIVTFLFLEPLKDDQSFLIIIGLSCLVFSFFNLRKNPIVFAGDVGSICMALLLGYLMLKLIKHTNDISYVLLFAVYGIDSVVTIFIRLLKKDNIFEPHRKHLYQYLANEMGFSHLSVSITYASIQALVNILVLYLFSRNLMTISVFIGFLLILSALYFAIRFFVEKKIKRFQPH
ncbi:MAG: hypothetical protein K2Q03_09940 [Sphingobacteriaceae bacterium]|nr:hypothetical protein [Sphingobacteriaceae bacterium]